MILLGGFSLDSAVAYYVAKKQVPANTIIRFSVFWSVLATLIIGLIFVPVYRWLTPGEEFPLGFILLYVGGNLLISFGNAIFYASYRFILPHLIAILVNSGIILLLLFRKGMQVEDFAFWYFAAFLVQGVILFVCLIFSQRNSTFEVRIPRETLVLFFRYASHAFLANILFFLLNRVDYLFVRHYTTATDLGNYIQVSRIAQLFFMLPSMISTVIFPFIASEKGMAAGVVRKISKVLGVTYLIILLLLAFTGKTLFPLIFGPSFSGMYFPFLLQIPGVIAVAMIYPYAAYNSGKNRIRTNYVGAFGALLVLLTGNLIFTPDYGILAAATISSLAYCCYYGYLVIAHHRQIEGA